MSVRRLFIAMTAVVMLAMAAVPTFAQSTTRTVTITEAQINSTYRINNPVRRQITHKKVDLQAGQVVISATVTGPNFGPFDVSVTFVPTVGGNGRVTWTVTAATANGQPASGEILTIINNDIMSSWRRYVYTHTNGRVTALTITDTEMIYSITTR